jgi:hypothetical protein
MYKKGIDIHLNLHLDSSKFCNGPVNFEKTRFNYTQVFEKLLPCKYYSVNVTAKTKVGEGVSQSINVQTNTDGEFL